MVCARLFTHRHVRVHMHSPTHSNTCIYTGSQVLTHMYTHALAHGIAHIHSCPCTYLLSHSLVHSHLLFAHPPASLPLHALGVSLRGRCPILLPLAAPHSVTCSLSCVRSRTLRGSGHSWAPTWGRSGRSPAWPTPAHSLGFLPSTPLHSTPLPSWDRQQPAALLMSPHYSARKGKLRHDLSPH